MFTVDPRDAAMAVAHVFAKTDVRYHDEVATACCDSAHRLLHDTILVVRAACLFVFVHRNSEQQHGLQSEVARALRFLADLA